VSSKTIAYVAYSDAMGGDPGLLVQDYDTEDGSTTDLAYTVDETCRRTSEDYPESAEAEERWDAALGAAGFRRAGDWTGSPGDGQVAAAVEALDAAATG